LPDPIRLATILLVTCSATAAIDVIWIHLIALRLYRHPATIYEHKLHAAHAAMAALSVALLFGLNLGGSWLWATVAAITIWLAVEVMDLLCEKKSRTKLGGLPNYEYTLHLMISGQRFAFVALMLAAKPVAAWRFDAPALLIPTHPSWVSMIGFAIAAGGAGIVALHIWLLHPRFRDAT
jgi:hypothetical protein